MIISFGRIRFEFLHLPDIKYGEEMDEEIAHKIFSVFLLSITTLFLYYLNKTILN